MKLSRPGKCGIAAALTIALTGWGAFFLLNKTKGLESQPQPRRESRTQSKAITDLGQLTQREKSNAVSQPEPIRPDITTTSDEFQDRKSIETWLKRDPVALIDWLITYPDNLSKKRHLLYFAICAMAEADPQRLNAFVAVHGDLYSRLNADEQREVLSRLSDSQVAAFETAKKQSAPPTVQHLIDQSRTLRDLRINGFASALEQVSSQNSGDLSSSAFVLIRNLPDVSPGALDEVYQTLRNGTWWGKDEPATLAVTLEMAKHAPELAIAEALKIDGIIGVSTSQSAFGQWFEMDPDAALQYLPRSNVTDPQIQYSWLQAVLKRTQDQELINEIRPMLENLKR